VLEDSEVAPELADEEPSVISFSEFLEKTPPSVPRKVDGPVIRTNSIHGTFYHLKNPNLRLYCAHAECNRTMVFRPNLENLKVVLTEAVFSYISYTCSNCQDTAKTFSLVVDLPADITLPVLCYKFGESPPFGPQTPSRLIKLIGGDRNLFLKGRQCENQGLGVGAFVYYRRVVENQKTESWKKSSGFLKSCLLHPI
jgi:hypothetical protein